MSSCISLIFFFFFNDTATTEIYTLSLHDALPIYRHVCHGTDQRDSRDVFGRCPPLPRWRAGRDRKSTRLNSSHVRISYAVFCLKKKKKKNRRRRKNENYNYCYIAIKL